MSQSQPTDLEQAHRDAMNAKSRLRMKLEELMSEYGNSDKAANEAKNKALTEDLYQETVRSAIIRMILNTERSQLELLDAAIREHLSLSLEQRQAIQATAQLAADVRSVVEKLKEMKNRYTGREGYTDHFVSGYQQGLAEAREEVRNILK